MWTRHHLIVFVLTFFCYVLFHASRKCFSNVKDNLSEEWTPSSCNQSWPCPAPKKVWMSQNLFATYSDAEPFLGILDTIFLFSYAVGLYISGIIGDRFELRAVLAIGMWLSGLMVFLFGTLTQWLHYYNKALYVTLWCLNGLIQSTGWPCVVAIVGNWFGKSGRGFIFGVWSSCASVGNIVGSLVASSIIDYGYEVVFLYASVTLFCGGFIALFGIISSPTDIGLPDPNFVTEPIDDAISNETLHSTNQESESDETSLIRSPEKSKPVSFFKALMLPGVLTYSFAFACLKLVNYSFIFWLPYYLTNNFGWSDSKAGDISIWYDVGSIFGGIAFGVVSDCSGHRAPTIVGMLIVAPFAVLGYANSPDNVAINCVLMSIVGIFIGGASNIIGTAVTADIGKQEAVGKNTDALATVTGIIDGTGSIGAGIGQYLVALIQSHVGWQWVFNSFMIEIAISVVCLAPMLAKDLKEFAVKARNKFSQLFRRTEVE